MTIKTEEVEIKMSCRGIETTSKIILESLEESKCFVYNFDDVGASILKEQLKHLCRVAQKPNEALRVKFSDRSSLLN